MSPTAKRSAAARAPAIHRIPVVVALALLAACALRRAPEGEAHSDAARTRRVGTLAHGAPDVAVAAVDAVVAVDAPEPPSVPARTVAQRSFRGRREDEWLRLMNDRPALRVLHHFSSTLHVFHLDLGDGIEVSFQPEQGSLGSFWRNEVASYHLARLLGIEHRVPPTIGKRVPFRVLAPYAGGARLRVDAQGMVVGSASVWMPVLHGTYLWRAVNRRVWEPWMNPGQSIPSRRRERARQLSEILLFDFLSGNHDRWNPGNIRVDEHRDLVFRDNDGGFQPRVINGRGHPEAVRRLPRAVWESLQRATSEALRDSIARDPVGREGSLVDPVAYAGYERRRRAVLAQLRESIRRNREGEVLPWP